MPQRVIIRYLNASRAGQSDEFPADGMRALVAGRSELADIRFDPQRDDMVSREHLRIMPQSPGSNVFVLSDLNSRNGTFVNHTRVTGTTVLNHNDVVQFGPQGPEFRFELDPPPAGSSRPTRLMGTEPARRSLATREVTVGDLSAPRPIGRATVERMLGDTFGKVKHESNKTMWVSLAAVALIVLVGAATLLALHRSSDASTEKAQQQQQLLLQLAQTVRQPRAADPAMTARIDQMSGELAKMIAENRQHALRPDDPANAAAANAARGNGVAAPSGAKSQGYDAAFEKASDEYRGGDTAAAYTDSVALISADASRYEAYFLAALSLTAMQRPADAVPVYQYALQAAPDAAKPGIEQKLEEAQRAAQQ